MKKNLILLTILLLVSGVELSAQNRLKLYGLKTELTPNPDQDAVDIDSDVAMQSITLKDIIADMGGIQQITDKIPLPFIDHDFLKSTVVPLMKKLYDYNYKMAEDKKEAARAELIKAIEDLSSEKLFELLLAANYLDIRILGKEREERQADIDSGLLLSAVDEIEKVIARKKELATDNAFLKKVLNLPSELQKPISVYLMENNRQLLINVLVKILKGHTSSITSVAITSDGRFALTGSRDKTARLWDLSADSITSQELAGHKDEVRSVAITSDGRFALTGSWDNTALLWDLKANPITSQELNAEWPVNDVALTPDGRYALTGSRARLWDLTANPITSQELLGHTAAVISVALTLDGRYALTSSIDHTARLWDLTANPLVSYELVGHNDQVRSAALSSDGRYALTGSHDTTARWWDLTANPITFKVLQGHTWPIESVALTPDGKYALTGSQDRTARLWDLTENPITFKQLTGHTNWIWAVALTPDGKFALTGSDDNTARLWDLTANPIKSQILQGHTDGIKSIAITPDGKYALTGSFDATARLWNLNLNNFNIVEIILIKKLQTQKENNLPSADVFANPVMAIALLDSKHREQIIEYFNISPEDIQALEEKYPLQKEEVSEIESKVE